MLRALRGKILVLFFILFVIAILPKVSASVVINEVMPHTNNSFGDEWVELYNPESSTTTLMNWMIADADSSDIINLTIFAYGFAIIADSSIGCSNFNISNESCIELPTIGSGLNDNNETFFLYDNLSNIIGSFSWDYSIKPKGKSFSFFNNCWQECFPTAGESNNCTIIQPNQLPTANFTYSPANPTANQTITFDASSSHDLDGSITLYSWNFGDGTNSTGITIQHNFTAAGNFTVNLTVTDSNNSQSSTIKAVSVLNPQNQTQPQNSSQDASLEITYAPAKAYFGDEIQVNLSVYRNDTAKYAVYLWVQDSEGNMFTDKATFHATPNKPANYTFNASLKIDSKCDLNSKESNYTIMLEGLDKKMNKTIILAENDSLCENDIEYKITPPEKAKIGETFSTLVKLTNNKHSDLEFDLWSYVYNGSKCYSCNDTREENLQHVLVKARASAEILLYNTVEDAEANTYLLKVKISGNDSEDSKDYRFNLILEAKTQEANQEAKAAGESNLNAQNINKTNSTVPGKTIYKSKAESDKKNAEIIFLSALAVLVLYFIFRPDIIKMRENGV